MLLILLKITVASVTTTVEDYTVQVYFQDGKIVLYDVKPNLNKGLFQKSNNIHVFMETCTVMNDTLAWVLEGNRDVSKCIDIDPETLYDLPSIDESIGGKRVLIL